MTNRIVSSSRNIAGYTHQCQSGGIREVCVSLHAAPKDTDGNDLYFLVLEGKTPHGKILTHVEYAGRVDKVFGCGYTASGETYTTPQEFGRAITLKAARGLGSIPRRRGLISEPADIERLVQDKSKELPRLSSEESVENYLSSLE